MRISAALIRLTAQCKFIDSIIKYSRDQAPLFYLLGAAWAQLAGWSQYALRLFSVLAGMLMIAWLYRFGSDMFNRRIGLLAAILMSTSAYMILYVHDFRMYTLLLLLAIIHTWLYGRLAHGHRVTRLTWHLFVGHGGRAVLYTPVFDHLACRAGALSFSLYFKVAPLAANSARLGHQRLILFALRPDHDFGSPGGFRKPERDNQSRAA